MQVEKWYVCVCVYALYCNERNSMFEHYADKLGNCMKKEFQNFKAAIVKNTHTQNYQNEKNEAKESDESLVAIAILLTFTLC